MSAVTATRANLYRSNYERLVTDLSGYYSRRINSQHRLVYEVFPETQTVHVLSMWSRYK
ncbi:Txe/YoeB family addiction module toxin [Schaalia turicensis]|uniref:Txe/YoeB family addiction module toxin n=1 Tax=Schaalia turicensis TaxID=131111 RepID=UPI00189BB046|nr:Txe/YoeB family addiction module toxin [Schaalia turicensis]